MRTRTLTLCIPIVKANRTAARRPFCGHLLIRHDDHALVVCVRHAELNGSFRRTRYFAFMFGSLTCSPKAKENLFDPVAL